MTTWKYLKGTAEDFEGAPEWAVMVEQMDYGKYFLEGREPHHRFENGTTGEQFITGRNAKQGTIIAQRERVTSVNDDRLANDLRPRSIYKPDGTVQFGCIPADVNALIAERGSRYGKFADGAEIMRDLKHVMHNVDGWNNLTASQKEALDMIQHKIGRILNGDPTYDDNWKDIAGYATLVAEELNEVKK